jgi:polyhydroxyalkanoate synthase
MFERLGNIARKLTTERPQVGMTPADVVHTENKWRLLHYRNDEVRHPTPILLVPSLINRHYVLDLMPGKSFVEWMLDRGHDVWIIDWGRPTAEDRFLEFDEFCDRYLGRAVRKTAKFAGTEKVHLLGYCLGGTLTTIYGALHPERIASMVNLAAPIDFTDDGLLTAWSQIDTFDLDYVLEAFGNMPWPLMQFGFHLLRPTLNLQKLVYALDRAWDDQFLDGFFALETWGNDNVSFPGAAFHKYINELYRENRLIRGELAINGRPVDLADIDFPTLVVSFEHDHIVPGESARCLLDEISSEDAEGLHMRGGHVGAVVSSKASTRLWPHISDWFVGHDEPTRTRLREAG